jgi:L-threonylcarbamoyladenylate synthase
MPVEILPIDALHPQAQVIDAVARVIREGGLAVFPTESVYCMGSISRSGGSVSGGVERLFELKRRGRGPSFPWLVSSVADLDVYGTNVTDEARALAEAFWPGSLSIVVKASAAVPRLLARQDGTVALRVSASPVVAALLQVAKAPLICSGASVHGASAPVSFGQVSRRIVDAADIALDAGLGYEGEGFVTIVDCTAEEPRVLREGVYSREDVDEALGIETPLV